MNEVQQYLIGKVLDAVSAYHLAVEDGNKDMIEQQMQYLMERWKELEAHEELHHDNLAFKNFCALFPDSFHD